jgi:hypothetical protein
MTMKVFLCGAAILAAQPAWASSLPSLDACFARQSHHWKLCTDRAQAFGHKCSDGPDGNSKCSDTARHMLISCGDAAQAEIDSCSGAAQAAIDAKWYKRTPSAIPDYAEAKDKITARCVREWPDNYVMRKFCIEHQSAAARALEDME